MTAAPDGIPDLLSLLDDLPVGPRVLAPAAAGEPLALVPHMPVAVAQPRAGARTFGRGRHGNALEQHRLACHMREALRRKYQAEARQKNKVALSEYLEANDPRLRCSMTMMPKLQQDYAIFTFKKRGLKRLHHLVRFTAAQLVNMAYSACIRCSDVAQQFRCDLSGPCSRKRAVSGLAARCERCSL